MISNRKYEKLALNGVRKENLLVVDLNSTSKGELNFFYSKASVDRKLAMAQEALTSELQNYELFGKERVSERIITDGIMLRRTL